MKKEQQFIEKQRLISTQFYIFQSDGIIKFQDFHKATNQQSSNIKKYQHYQNNNNSHNDDKIIGIKLYPKFQLGIYKLINHKYVLIDNILSQNTGIRFLQSILMKIQNKDKIDIRKLVFQAFEKQAINKADLFVNDIYGPDSSTIGIPGYILASSLGMLAKKGIESYAKNQIIRSVIIGTCLTIAQITGLNAKKFKIETIIMMQNPLKSIIFDRYIYTLLKFYNPNAKILFKNQNYETK